MRRGSEELAAELRCHDSSGVCWAASQSGLFLNDLQHLSDCGPASEPLSAFRVISIAVGLLGLQFVCFKSVK